MADWTRRDVLRLAAGVAVAGPVAAQEPVPPLPPAPLPPVPRTMLAVNVHPLRTFARGTDEILPELVALQLQAVYELGFNGLRVTLPFGDRANLLGAVPYVRAARALGIDALGILADFSGFTLAQALADPDRRDVVLAAYDEVFGAPVAPASSTVTRAGRIAFQVLNEPVNFLGIPPEAYVRELLNPAFGFLKRRDPELIVVAAAEVGHLEGPPRMRAMLEAGLEDVCDRIAYHVYDRRVIPLLSANVRGLVWITETGTPGPENHLAWVRDVVPEIRSTIGDATSVFYYDLFDTDPRRYRIFDIVPDPALGFRLQVESSELHAYLSGLVREREGGRPHAAFMDLIPDVRVYFPTAADVRILDEALTHR
jgi:hypothetical protein